MKTKRMVKVAGIVVLALLVTLVPFIGGCAPEEVAPPAEEEVAPAEEEVAPAEEEVAPAEEEVAPREFPILLITDYTGPFSTYSVGESHGVIDAYAWANKHNYIPGVTFAVEGVDTGGEVEKCMTAYRRAMARSEAEKPILTHTVGTAFTYALQPSFIEDDMPAVSPTAVGRTMLPPMQCFGDCVPYEDQCGAFVDWFMSRWEEDRPARFAFVALDAAAGRAVVTPTVKAYIRSKGAEVVSEQYIPFAPLDCDSQVLALKAAEVDFTWGVLVAAPTIAFCRSLAKLDAKDIAACSASWCHPHHVVAECGADAEGFLTTIWYDLPSEWRQNEAVWNAFKDGNRPEIEHTGEWMAGWMEGNFSIEALKIAIADVGVENVDRHAMYQAMMKVDTTCQGVTSASFTRDRHWAAETMGIARITAKKLVTPEEDSVWAEWVAPRGSIFSPSPSLMRPAE